MIKAYITAKEYRRVYFKYGSINALPDKVLVEVRPANLTKEYSLMGDKCFCGSAECPAWKSAKENL